MSKNVEKNRKARGVLARRYIQSTLDNPSDPLYTASDTSLAKMLGITRLTVIKIRQEMDIANRNCRLVNLLRSIDTAKFTIKELAEKLHVKYISIYKLLRDLHLETRADRRPIDAMIEYQMRRKSKVRD